MLEYRCCPTITLCKKKFRSFSLFPIQNWSTGSQDKPWIYHKYRNTQIHKYTNTNTIFCFQSASIVILIHIPNIFHQFEPRLTNFGKWLPLQSLLTSILNFVIYWFLLSLNYFIFSPGIGTDIHLGLCK